MKDIPVALLVEGSFKNVVIPVELLGELASKLREEGKYFVHTVKESYEVEGFVVLGKGTKHKMMVIAEGDSE